MGEAHRAPELKSLAVESLDREGEEAAGGERAPARRKDRLEVAKIAEGVTGEDQVEGARGRAREIGGRFGGLERVIDSALSRFRDHGRGEIDPDEAVDARSDGFAHETGAAADIEGRGEAAAPL